MNKVVFGQLLRETCGNRYYAAFALFIVVQGVVIGIYARHIDRVWLFVATVLIGSLALGPDTGRGLVQLVLVRPVSRAEYVLSRFAAALCAIMLLIAASAAGHVSGAIGSHGGHISDFLWEHAAAAVDASVDVAVLVFFGSFTTSYLNIPCYGALRILLPSLSAPLGQWLSPESWQFRILASIQASVMPRARPDAVTFYGDLHAALAASAAFLFLAVVIFGRRELPYASD